MQNKTFYALIVSIVLILCSSSGVSAQNEIERQRSSLRGILEMGFTVTIEADSALSKRKELEVTSIKQQAVTTLKNAGLNIIPDEQIRSSADLPFLYMHINTMNAGRGLVPFSIALDLYQPATLTGPDMQTSVSSWQTGLVGIVSYDRLNIIGESAVNILQDFISDYHQVNR